MSVHSRDPEDLLQVPTEMETSERVWTFRRRDKFPPCDNRTPDDPPSSLVTIPVKQQGHSLICGAKHLAWPAEGTAVST